MRSLLTNNEKINDLSEEIRALRVNSGNPTQNQVKPIHHFYKQVWLSVSLFLISLLLAYGWINCINQKKTFEANDMKYRFWKANGNRSYHASERVILNKSIISGRGIYFFSSVTNILLTLSALYRHEQPSVQW